MSLSMKYTGELDMAYYFFIGVDILGFILISRINKLEKVVENGCNVRVEDA